MSRFQFVEDNRGAYGVKRLCRILGISRSGCYRWQAAALRNAERPVNHKKAGRLMRGLGITGVHLRKKVRTTIPEPSAAPVADLLERDFTAQAPNTRYVGDITYLNAAAEAFNASLKRETLQGAKRWPGARAARLAVFRRATRYNTRRLHCALGHRSPSTTNTQKP
jgi:transposase InsO family protein